MRRTGQQRVQCISPEEQEDQTIKPFSCSHAKASVGGTTENIKLCHGKASRPDIRGILGGLFILHLIAC